MYKVSFVILHYMSFDCTNECIESIIKSINFSDYDYNIVLVDNASKNDSFIKLKDKFEKYQNIYFIKNKNNLGFAKGNNVGYKFAKYELNSDFIILLNNDTVIKQSDFIDVIIKKFEETNYFVLGPDIINSSGIHQNPQRINLIELKELKNMIKKTKVKLLLNYLGLEDIIVDLYKFLKSLLKSNEKQQTNYHDNEQINVQLHGACLIFSPLYVSKFDGLYDKTFLYMEEDILFYTMQKENYKTLYSPDIKIIHKEDGSTDFVYKENSKKRRFIYKNLIKSSRIYLDYINNYELEKYNFMVK